jgi:hypothetical protein
MTTIDAELLPCGQCGKLFKPRNGTGGSPQRFCSTNCRLSFHAEGQRGQRRPACSAPGTPPAVLQPTSASEACEARKGFVPIGQQDFIAVPIGQQDFIAVAWDRQGNLLLRQSRLYEGDHELHIGREYFPRFLETVDALRELIVEAIRKDRAR